jgi:protein-tyrosine-phosphatase
MPSILFVCTANMVRSPMAMALWRQMLGAAALDWQVESAGTWTVDGQPAAARAIQALKDRGALLSGHRSRPVSAELLRRFDLILVMETGHKEALKVEFPEVAGRVYLLSEMVGSRYDIPDPIGGPLSDYVETANEIERILSKGYGRICQLCQAAQAGPAAPAEPGG